MSGGKHIEYKSKIHGATGLGKALAIGGGTPSSPGPLIKNVLFATLADASATLAVANMHGILSVTPTAQRTLTSPTAALIIAAFPELEAGTAMDLYVENLAAATHDLVMAGGTGVTPVPTVMEVRPLSTAHILVHATSSSAITMRLLSDTGAST